MILITGGTGFLGSHISARLIERGEKVILVARAKKGVTAGERVSRLLDWHGVKPAQRRNVRVAEGRLESPGLGLNPDAADIVRDVDEIIHCASRVDAAASILSAPLTLLEFEPGVAQRNW
jgi:thioester reductase-like protein